MSVILAAENVTMQFGAHRAVDDTSLALRRGESLGLVGESGCGKTTLLRLLLRLMPPSAGRILHDGTDVTAATGRALAGFRRSVQVVFQNPRAALDPRSTVFASVAEPLRLQGGHSRADLRAKVNALLADVGLPRDFLWRYPHELSGGQAQRVCIARALAPEPAVLLLDEPTSALDVSVQAQILELLQRLRAEHGLSYLFVSHNLAVVRLLCERVAVMRQGKLVEEGPAAEILARPRHEYTAALIASVLPPLPPGARRPATLDATR